jgi:hypothetical protein
MVTIGDEVWALHSARSYYVLRRREGYHQVVGVLDHIHGGWADTSRFFSVESNDPATELVNIC